jgi:hypothetical protein
MHGLEALIGWLMRPHAEEDAPAAPPPRTGFEGLLKEADRSAPVEIVPLAYPLSRCHIFGVCP